MSMSYIITQSQEVTVNDISRIDAMIDEEGEHIYCFKTYEEAATYLQSYGVRELRTGFPFNIKIERLQ